MSGLGKGNTRQGQKQLHSGRPKSAGEIDLEAGREKLGLSGDDSACSRCGKTQPEMTPSLLAGLLAERVFNWVVAPDRFLLGSRQWKPRHYFQPTKRVVDAFRLLEASAPEQYTICRVKNGYCSAQIQINGQMGEAKEHSEAVAVTFAVARALGIPVVSLEGQAQ